MAASAKATIADCATAYARLMTVVPLVTDECVPYIRPDRAQPCARVHKAAFCAYAYLTYLLLLLLRVRRRAPLPFCVLYSIRLPSNPPLSF